MNKGIVLFGLVCVLASGCARESAGPAAPSQPAAPGDPGKAQALYERGLDIQRRGQVREAIKLFYEAVEADPGTSTRCAWRTSPPRWSRTSRTPASPT